MKLLTLISLSIIIFIQTIHIVEGAGHFVQLDQPNITTELIRSFMSKLNLLAHRQDSNR